MKQNCILTFLLILFTGCSYYSLSGSLPGHIKTCAVPLFENETVEVDIVENITAEVIDAVIRDGNMEVVGEFQSDAIVNGTIVDVIDMPDTYSKDEEAKQFKISIYANVQFFDRKKNQVIWEENNMLGWANYDAGDISAREEGIQEALEMLAKEIIDKTVSGW
ncbi:LPS assembly lipoprotein LptE [Candidatus Latescibacterota bacterium]